MVNSTAASTTDEIIIPLDRYVNLSNNITVHLIQITLSKIPYYNTITPEPENTVWPIIVFKYENHGISQAACRLHVRLVDNTSTVPAGWKYDRTDETVYQPLFPNQASSVIPMEFSMPKDRVLTNLSIIDDTLHREIANIPIIYPSPSSETPVPVPGIFDEGGDSIRNLMLIPILLGLAGLIGWFMARRRLF